MKPARETLSGFRQAGDAALSALMDLGESVGAKYPLSERPGRGRTILSFGMDRLRLHAAQMGMNAEGVDYVERRAEEEYGKAIAITESPIERAMLAALITGHWSGFETIPARVHSAAKESLEMLPPGDLIIVPQLAFVRYRLDFGLVVEKGGQRNIVAVECDGANFHADAVKDRFRDAYLRSWNIPTFRVKGSEIHEDAIAAADELIGSICLWRSS